MSKTNRTWVSRMLRTFIQTAAGCLAVGLPTVNFNDGWDIVKKSLIGLAITAIASGLAAAMNIYDEKENKETTDEETPTEDIVVEETVVEPNGEIVEEAIEETTDNENGNED